MHVHLRVEAQLVDHHHHHPPLHPDNQEVVKGCEPSESAVLAGHCLDSRELEFSLLPA